MQVNTHHPTEESSGGLPSTTSQQTQGEPGAQKVNSVTQPLFLQPQGQPFNFTHRTYTDLAEFFLRKNCFQEALKTLRDGMDMLPDAKEIHAKYISINLLMRNFQEAQIHFASCQEIFYEDVLWIEYIQNLMSVTLGFGNRRNAQAVKPRPDPSQTNFGDYSMPKPEPIPEKAVSILSALSPEGHLAYTAEETVLKMLTLLRYATEFRFTIPKPTDDFIKKHAHLIVDYPQKQLKLELEKHFLKGNALENFLLFREFGMLDKIVPGIDLTNHLWLIGELGVTDLMVRKNARVSIDYVCALFLTEKVRNRLRTQEGLDSAIRGVVNDVITKDHGFLSFDEGQRDHITELLRQCSYRRFETKR